MPTQGLPGGAIVIAKVALALALLASVVAGIQTWRLGNLPHQLAEAERDFGICDATLTAYLEGDDIDAAIPDDLDGFVVPDHWRVQPSSPAPAP
jgi:hypothetical protein